ncbi:MAG: CHASE2 domain-containing protein [Acidobacteria bacterium]|nr:CHASE2 domain-containing protein [Acidobacteriota bacterium]
MPGKPDRQRPGGLWAIGRAWWQHKVSLGISLGLTAAALLVYVLTFLGERPTPIFEFLQRLELDALDTRFRYRPRQYTHPDPRVIIVDIDQGSQEVLGRWPFSRSHFARLLDVLREDGARSVAFDITFSEPDRSADPIRALRARLEARQEAGEKTDPRLAAELAQLEAEYNSDEQFARAIDRFGRVVLGNFFLYTEADLKGLDEATLDRYANMLGFFPFPQIRPLHPASGKQDRLSLIQNYAPFKLLPRGTQANIDVLTDALRGEKAATGFFNVRPDPDGVVRRALLALPYGRAQNYDDWDLYASLDVQTVRVYLHLANEKAVLSFDETGIVNLEFGPSLRVRPDAIGRVMINYQGPVRTYAYVSIADAVQHKFAPGTFRDKIVLVGASATGIGDLRATPFGGIDYPGVEIHANVIDNILNQNFLVRGAAQASVDVALIFLFGIPLGLWLALTQPRWMWFGLLLLAPFVAGLYFAFLKGWWLNFSIPFLTIVSNVGLVALYRALLEEKEKRKVRGAFQQYLSPEVIRRLLENPELVQPRKTEITVMFSDIRDFTTISEQLDAQVLAVLLNQYLTDMTQIVFARAGTLDKYIGDAVMAFWGAPFESPGHAGDACRAALEMIRRVAELQKQWKVGNKPHLEIGIGLNTGVASVGNMGSKLRYGYTAMGDPVNLASRLEGLNKEYRTHIIASEITYQAARDTGFLFRELDLIRVKGKTQPVTIYELVAPQGGASPAAGDLTDRLAMFARGRACYQRRQWREAQAIFEQLLARWPDDGPARRDRVAATEYPSHTRHSLR